MAAIGALYHIPPDILRIISHSVYSTTQIFPLQWIWIFNLSYSKWSRVGIPNYSFLFMTSDELQKGERLMARRQEQGTHFCFGESPPQCFMLRVHHFDTVFITAWRMRNVLWNYVKIFLLCSPQRYILDIEIKLNVHLTNNSILVTLEEVHNIEIIICYHIHIQVKVE